MKRFLDSQDVTNLHGRTRYQREQEERERFYTSVGIALALAGLIALTAYIKWVNHAG